MSDQHSREMDILLTVLTRDPWVDPSIKRAVLIAANDIRKLREAREKKDES